MKTILLLVTILASAFGARAQGLIFWGNNVNSTKISTNSLVGGAATGMTAPVVNLYYFALFYSTTATMVSGSTNAQMPGLGIGAYAFDDPNWTFVAYGTNSPSIPGRFSASVQNADGTTTVTGVPGGSFAQFVVLGWSANLGSTLAAMESAIFTGGYGWMGESAVSGPLQLGNGGIIPAPGIFGNSSPGVPGFTLGAFPIPEPSSLGLTAVGLAGLFFFRRRASV